MLLAITMVGGCGSGEDKSSPEAEKSVEQDSTAAENKDTAKNDRRRSARREGNGPGGFEENTTIPVEVTPVSRGNISSSLLYSSTLETENTVDVYPRIGGLVVAIYTDEGGQVARNGAMLQIEKDEYDLDARNAELEFKKQESNFKRLEQLQSEELLSQEEFENARLTRDQAKIAWERAELTLEQTTVRSPISGVVGERAVRLGARVNTSTKLFTVVNLQEKIVNLFIPQNEFANTFIGQEAVVSSDVVPGLRLKGSVKRKSPVIDRQSGTFKITVALKDAENRLSPGMFVRAELIVETRKNTRLIPKSALIYENERSFFFVAEADSAVKVELQKGFEDAEKVEVLNDLPDTARIVVLGQSGLKDGTKINITAEKSFAWQTGETRAELARHGG